MIENTPRTLRLIRELSEALRGARGTSTERRLLRELVDDVIEPILLDSPTDQGSGVPNGSCCYCEVFPCTCND